MNTIEPDYIHETRLAPIDDVISQQMRSEWLLEQLGEDDTYLFIKVKNNKLNRFIVKMMKFSIFEK